MTSNGDKLDNGIEIGVFKGRDVITHLEIILWFLCPKDKIHQGKKFAHDAFIILDFHCHNVTMAIVDCWREIQAAVKGTCYGVGSSSE